MINNRDLVEHLKNAGILQSGPISCALEEIDRADFVPEKYQPYAYYDDALPIGCDQTISQPFTVVFMLELLGIEDGDIVMDVGSGSGWQSCLLAHMVGDSGFVHAIEVVPELCDFGKQNSAKYPTLMKRLKFYCENAKDGLPDIADGNNGFDKIICAAEVDTVPNAWRDQLKENGVLVYPKDSGVYKEIKLENNKFEKEFYPGFIFVPFKKD
ncbi:methyltransferase domain-containing protein [Patescibacteria group bacterium]|nr:methyltransferase domain-containing protein [Patescibacteria group bacterium]